MTATESSPSHEGVETIIIIGVAVVVGGPVLMLLGMFVAWLLPGIILGGLALLILMAIGRAIDKGAGQGN